MIYDIWHYYYYYYYYYHYYYYYILYYIILYYHGSVLYSFHGALGMFDSWRFVENTCGGCEELLWFHTWLVSLLSRTSILWRTFKTVHFVNVSFHSNNCNGAVAAYHIQKMSLLRTFCLKTGKCRFSQVPQGGFLYNTAQIFCENLKMHSG